MLLMNFMPAKPTRFKRANSGNSRALPTEPSMKLVAAAILSLATCVSIEDGKGRVLPIAGPCARYERATARMPKGVLASKSARTWG